MKEPSTFDPKRSGHIVKLIVGYAQEFGALLFEEIEYIVAKFAEHVSADQIRSYLLCAVLVGWIEERTKGFKKFYVAKPERPAISFSIKSAVLERNGRRRRAQIRMYWEEHDVHRFRAISEVVSEA